MNDNEEICDAIISFGRTVVLGDHYLSTVCLAVGPLRRDKGAIRQDRNWKQREESQTHPSPMTEEVIRDAKKPRRKFICGF